MARVRLESRSDLFTRERTVALKESRAGRASGALVGNWRRIHANEKCERVYAAV
jgi:hypothetical protein